MMVPETIKTGIEDRLTQEKGLPVKIKSTASIGGGCINNASEIVTTSGRYFLKYNLALKYPDMFEKESLELKLLASAGNIRLPEVVFHSTAGEYAFLLLEMIESGAGQPGFWTDFGSSLAALHGHSAEMFGLDHDNYMGSLRQSNRFHPGWCDFFVAERLEPQLKMARDTGHISISAIKSFDNLYRKLPELIPVEKPALIHGDLWNGNFMVSEEGKACLIDPAAYYGHRESDIAMTKLFGGFSEDFYSAYNSAWPLEKGWQQRIDILNLYPLLIHVNLFGISYLRDVQNIVRQF
ncbi:MAG TPA: fructosamine kinase family protein [Bacteroidales bacterium]|nr:fructosamine kinase family protein [Bacteroidales bacterium]